MENLIEQIVTVLFYPGDSIGGPVGLLVQTIVFFCLGVIPGLVLRVGLFTVMLAPLGCLLLVFSLPFGLSIGFALYGFGVMLLGVTAGSALAEAIKTRSTRLGVR